eukprot:CAMPEP_0175058480 /NCGR_PEP_ID=MMETSP0052_2-20121109/11870_1 /TAXON_ID=51329 ORGANISM="Polytomella parva, Strain SAG 63-3" /NCGR_SAMPLE_ID=MMETSP0052_2 /ASSEMBLY_ACC=CAM_ASM_000194 /LENGTH=221 /DNA_ID=CAMNT_0016323863 /DNA_START=546 /DNA_END=1211 /DNA_ORIENTATION=-
MTGTETGEKITAFNQSASRLDEIINNDDMAAFGLALLELDNTFGSIADLGTDNLREAVGLELVVETLPGALIGIGNGDVTSVGEHPEALQEERYTGLEQREDGVTEIKALLQGVDVEDDKAGRSTTGQGNMRQEAGQSVSSGDVTLILHPFHGSRGEKGKDKRERAYEQTRKSINDRNLLENNGRVMERAQKSHMLIADVDGIINKKVRESIREFPPFNLS